MKKNKPLKTIRVGRGVKAVIWANKTKNNGTTYNVEIWRTYKDENGEFHDRNNFSKDHMPFVEKASDAAFRFIHELAGSTDSK